MSSKPICTLCGSLDNWMIRSETGLHGVTESVRRGCAGRVVVVQILLAFREQYGFQDLPPEEDIDCFSLQSWPTPTLHIRKPDHSRQVLHLFTTTERTCPWTRLPATTVVSMDTASAEAFSTLESWIRECSNSHDPCKYLLQMSQLPTRVVEILDSDTVRVKETSNERGRYICLSHCWGALPILCTTRASLATHQASIARTSLPKTFRDAVDITHRLGVRYIWIDSLCIVQDDVDDWRREGGRMCDIYSHSYLTIAAAKSKDSSGGLFSSTQEPVYAKTHSFDSPMGESYSVHVREAINHIGPLDDVLWYHLKPGSHYPLMKRAWAFQERYLSPRVVHYGEVELSWECRGAVTCECSGWGSEYIQDHSDKMRMCLPDHASLSERHELWLQIVTWYTMRDLKYASDIFPALQGIAKSMRMGSEYCAGHWNDDSLVRSLLWRMSYGESTRPEVWRAPSWSWASVKAKVSFPSSYELVRVLVSVLDIRTKPVGRDPFGQLQSGSLRLTGQCAQGRIVQRGSQKEKSERVRLILSAPGTDTEHHTVSFRPDFNEDALEGRAVKVMKFALTRFNEKSGDLYCLAYLCKDQDRELYERVGFLQIRKSEKRRLAFGAKEV